MAAAGLLLLVLCVPVMEVVARSMVGAAMTMQVTVVRVAYDTARRALIFRLRPSHPFGPYLVRLRMRARTARYMSMAGVYALPALVSWNTASLLQIDISHAHRSLVWNGVWQCHL